jgi:hypothetical protein
MNALSDDTDLRRMLRLICYAILLATVVAVVVFV